MEALAIATIGVILGFALGAVQLYYSLEVSRRDLAGLRLDYEYPFNMAAYLLPTMLAAAFLSALGFLVVFGGVVLASLCTASGGLRPPACKPDPTGASSASADAERPNSVKTPDNKPTQRFMILPEPSRKRAKRARLAKCPKARRRWFLEAPAERRGSPSPPKPR